jgi:hypothetical protein
MLIDSSILESNLFSFGHPKLYYVYFRNICAGLV